MLKYPGRDGYIQTVNTYDHLIKRKEKIMNIQKTNCSEINLSNNELTEIKGIAQQALQLAHRESLRINAAKTVVDFRSGEAFCRAVITDNNNAGTRPGAPLCHVRGCLYDKDNVKLYESVGHPNIIARMLAEKLSKRFTVEKAEKQDVHVMRVHDISGKASIPIQAPAINDDPVNNALIANDLCYRVLLTDMASRPVNLKYLIAIDGAKYHVNVSCRKEPDPLGRIHDRITFTTVDSIGDTMVYDLWQMSDRDAITQKDLLHTCLGTVCATFEK